MAQFGVYEIKGRGLVLDCQHDFLSDLNTRVVAPLRVAGDPIGSFARLNPEVEVNGRRYRIAMQLLRAVDRRDLGPLVVRLDDDDFTIMAALDLLISGF